MPARNIQLYAKWVTKKFQVNVIPNGGEMNELDSVSFNLDPGEKVTFASDPTRDYVKVSSGGSHVYDAVNGRYEEPEEAGTGDYMQRSGAYTFQGWYEAQMDSDATELEQYEKDGEVRYRYKQTGTPVKDNEGGYKVKRRFNLNVAPNRPVTIVAMWQRAGGFRVEYEATDALVQDKNGAYKKMTSDTYIPAPEDDNEYMDDSHAVVQPAISAPKGYTLDHWALCGEPGENGEPNVLEAKQPNELVHVSETHAVQDGSDMVVKLVAVYRVYEPSERDMADYTFMTPTVKDGVWTYDNKYDVQRIAINEQLKAPITPQAPEAGYVFKGWYYDSRGSQQFNGFGTITNPVYTTLYAVFEKAITVNYYLTDTHTMEPSQNNTVIATQVYPDDGKHYMDTRGVVHPVDVDHYVDMWVSDWSKRDNPAYQYDYKTASSKVLTTETPGMHDGVMSMYAVLKARTYVQFDSRGGSFVDMQEIPDGGWPVRPADPTRAGYTFDGWYTQPAGGARYDFDKTFEDVRRDDDAAFDPANAVLYARWIANGDTKVPLTVIWWAETKEGNGSSKDNKDYEFKKSETISVDEGTVTLDSLLASHPGYAGVANLNDPDSGYFELNRGYSTASVEASGDGGAVMHLRFTRIRYTLDFYPTSQFKIRYNGVEYDRTNRYKFEAWIGKEIGVQWPVLREDGEPTLTNAGYWKAGSGDTANSYTSLVLQADSSVLSHADANHVVKIDGVNRMTGTVTRMHFYLDGVEATDLGYTIDANTTYDGSVKSYRHNGTTLQYANPFAFREITGYSAEFDKASPAIANGFLVHGYDLGVDSTDTTNYNRIWAQHRLASGVHHVSWFYKKNSYTVNFWLSDSERYAWPSAGGSKSSISIPYNDSVPSAIAAENIPDPESPDPDNVFLGWSVTKDAYAPFTGPMPAYDINLYAVFGPVTYTVTTVGVDQNGNADATDDQGNPRTFEDGTYTATSGQKLKELRIPNANAEGKLFKGWKIYKADTTITGNYKINDNLKIEPVWENLDERTVEYYANDPNAELAEGEEDTPLGLDNNKYMVGAKVVIQDGSHLSITRTSIDDEEYQATFAYWNTEPDGSGDSFYPNTTYTFRRDSASTLKLYAIYSQYHETKLTYHLNAPTTQARFMEVESGLPYPFGEGVVPEIVIKYRDKLDHYDYANPHHKSPNIVFPVGEDDEGTMFSATRTDTVNNNRYIMAGWAPESNANVVYARNGDRAYVNTIANASKGGVRQSDGTVENELYAVWAICKIDVGSTEHVFDSLNGAVEYAREHLNGEATIKMLVDYNMPADDFLDLGENQVTVGDETVAVTDDITITTANTAAVDDGKDYHYLGTGTTATITKAFNGNRMARVHDSGALALQNVTLSGGTATTTTNGACAMLEDTSSLSMGQDATITGFKTSGAGAGVYVSNGATLYLAGNPSFGGAGTNEDGSLVAAFNADGTLNTNAGNYQMSALEDATNGGEDYAVARQDVYLAGVGAPLRSLVVTDNLTSGAGSIWVWANDAQGDDGAQNHYKLQKQFGVFELRDGMSMEDVTEDTYLVFRNARADADSEASAEYLTGSAEGEEDETQPWIYWSGVKDSHEVVLRKVEAGTYNSITAAEFTVYRGKGNSAYKLKHEDGTREELSGLKCPQGETHGVFWVGTLPYGTYIIQETVVPSGYEAGADGEWFYLLVDDRGATMSAGFTARASAEAAAKEAADAHKAELQAQAGA